MYSDFTQIVPQNASNRTSTSQIGPQRASNKYKMCLNNGGGGLVDIVNFKPFLFLFPTNPNICALAGKIVGV